MLTRPLVAASSLVAAACVLAAPASAHHAATVSATALSLTVGPPGCASYERRPVSRCDGSRRAHVTWSATCGARPFVTVDYWAARKGGGKPISLATEEVDDQASGVTTAIVAPGAHVYATVTMDCFWSDPDGAGPPAHSVAVTSAPTAEVVVPPWLRQVSVIKNNTCNFNPGGRDILQAGQRGSILDLGTDYLDKSLLGVSRRSAAGARQRWANAKGAGIRARKHPELFMLAEFGRRDPVSGALRVNPRRPGWLKVWEEVGGVRSNTLAVKVAPNRC
jgi:hypothetical protein